MLPRLKAGFAVLVVGSATAVFGANNLTVTPPAQMQSVKEARVFEDYTIINMKRVFFSSDTADVSARDSAALSRLALQLRANTKSIVELRGYADGAESAEQGSALGSLRAETIALYLRDHGVPSDRIRLMAFQEIEDAGAVSNSEHRRVDLRVFVPPASERH